MDSNILKNKIKLVSDNLEKLQKNLPENFEDFHKNDLVLSASERFFQIIVDAVIDCNQILIEQNNLEVGETYFDTFRILSKTEIFPSELLRKMSYCVGARNAIVHRYENIQIKREYEDIKKFIPMFLEYLKIISEKYL